MSSAKDELNMLTDLHFAHLRSFFISELGSENGVQMDAVIFHAPIVSFSHRNAITSNVFTVQYPLSKWPSGFPLRPERTTAARS